MKMWRGIQDCHASMTIPASKVSLETRAGKLPATRGELGYPVARRPLHAPDSVGRRTAIINTW
jgi:hypothetical protein